jgi:hypothetical protein
MKMCTFKWEGSPTLEAPGLKTMYGGRHFKITGKSTFGAE